MFRTTNSAPLWAEDASLLRTYLLVQEEDMPSCPKGRHVLFCNTRPVSLLHVLSFGKKTCLLLETYLLGNHVHVFLLDKKTFLLVGQEEMSSGWTRSHAFLRKRGHVFLSDKKTCLRVGQGDMSSCWKREHVFFHKTGLLAEQEDMPSCAVNTQ